MRRIILMLMVVMVVGLSATAAIAALSAEAKADLDALTAAIADLDSATTVEEFEAGYSATKDAAATLKASAGDELDLGALQAAVDNLGAALDGGTQTNVVDSAALVVAAGADVVAQAEAADAADTGDGTAAPTAVDTGSAVNDGPNTALLGVGALLALLAGGAFVLRRTADRR